MLNLWCSKMYQENPRLRNMSVTRFASAAKALINNCSFYNRREWLIQTKMQDISCQDGCINHKCRDLALVFFRLRNDFILDRERKRKIRGGEERNCGNTQMRCACVTWWLLKQRRNEVISAERYSRKPWMKALWSFKVRCPHTAPDPLISKASVWANSVPPGCLTSPSIRGIKEAKASLSLLYQPSLTGGSEGFTFCAFHTALVYFK